jgi:hypothetical protein
LRLTNSYRAAKRNVIFIWEIPFLALLRFFRVLDVIQDSVGYNKYRNPISLASPFTCRLAENPGLVAAAKSASGKLH